jgi:hypothetical protein
MVGYRNGALDHQVKVYRSKSAEPEGFSVGIYFPGLPLSIVTKVRHYACDVRSSLEFFKIPDDKIEEALGAISHYIDSELLQSSNRS